MTMLFVISWTHTVFHSSEHKLICNDFMCIVSPLSLFLSNCVWIYSTELCINHIRLRITENRGLSYPGQCSLLGHYQRLQDNAENRFCSVCMRASVWVHPQRSRISAFTKWFYTRIWPSKITGNIKYNRNPIFVITYKPAI